jgi:hypothetical protein
VNRIRIWFDNLRVDSFTGCLLVAVIGFCIMAFWAVCWKAGGG